MGQVMQAFHHVPLFLCASDAWRCSPSRPLCPRPRGTWDAGAELVPIERRGQSGLRVAGSTTDRPRFGHVSEQQWLMRPLARWYQNNVSHELAKYGEFLLCVCVCHGSFLDPWWVDCLATAWQPDWPRPAQQVSYPLCSALTSPAPFASPSQRFLFDHPSICCGLCGVQGSSWMTCATSGIRTCRQRCLGFRLRSSPTATSGSSAPWICL